MAIWMVKALTFLILDWFGQKIENFASTSSGVAIDIFNWYAVQKTISVAEIVKALALMKRDDILSAISDKM